MDSLIKEKLLKQKSSAENGIPELCPEAITEAQQRADLTVRERATATIEFLRSNSSELGTVLTIPRFNEEDASLPLKELEKQVRGFVQITLCFGMCGRSRTGDGAKLFVQTEKILNMIKSDSGFKVMI